MPYLINIGSGGDNSRNLTGVGSRGYQIFRVGMVVVCRWAGVSVSHRRQFTWTRIPAEKRFRYRTVAAAREFLTLRVSNMTRVASGYSVLSRGIRITRHPNWPLKRATETKSRARSRNIPKGIRLAISIRQPLVELILRGEKKWEFRSQFTAIRERVFLYASLRPFDGESQWRKLRKRPGSLPTGQILGTVEIVGCVRNSDGDFKYKLSAPERIRPFLTAQNQPQPRFWRPKF